MSNPKTKQEVVELFAQALDCCLTQGKGCDECKLSKGSYTSIENRLCELMDVLVFHHEDNIK